MGADKVTIDLNGQTIYERPLEPTLGRQFGLFHYKDQTSAQVRNRRPPGPMAGDPHARTIWPA